jgi:hypothetical protein
LEQPVSRPCPRRWNVVERWSPKGAVRSFGMHVLDLSGLSIPESERQ